MSIENFVKSLMPEFEKSSILNDIENSRKALTEITIPAYTQAEKSMKVAGWKSGTHDYIQQTFVAETKHRNIKDVPGTIILGLNNAVKSLDILSGLVEDNFRQEVTAASLTYKKAAIIQVISAITMFGDYALRLLNILLIAETKGMSSEEFRTSKQREFVYLNRDLRAFCAVLKIMLDGPAKVKSQISGSAELIIHPDKATAVKAVQGPSAVNAFPALGFTVIWNPIYHIRMRWAEFQVARLRAAKERKEILQLRLLYLERQREGKSDAALERQIEYTQNRINDMDYKIHELTLGD